MTWDCTGEGQRPLTPALSHLPPPRLRQAGPMGEGGRSDALEERDACGLAGSAGGVPSPVGRERVRVRVPCGHAYELEGDVE